MMKKILCPKCGEIPFYTNFEIQKVYFAFDANEDEYDIALDPMGIRGSSIPRCYRCGLKVKILEANADE